VFVTSSNGDILPTACTMILMVKNSTKINVYSQASWVDTIQAHDRQRDSCSGCSYCHLLHVPRSQVTVLWGRSGTSSEDETYRRPETSTPHQVHITRNLISDN